ncbi:MAG TPA: hypothetical protein VH519_15700 [Hyphomicrobiaceae bacterium]|jgi:hypothetical protein
MALECARAFLAIAGIIVLTLARGCDPVLAQASEHKEADRKEGGCWARGRWYPEGARVAPDPRSRLMAKGEFVCRSGRWVFEPTP